MFKLKAYTIYGSETILKVHQLIPLLESKITEYEKSTDVYRRVVLRIEIDLILELMTFDEKTKHNIIEHLKVI